jgi:hypothetical protein
MVELVHKGILVATRSSLRFVSLLHSVGLIDIHGIVKGDFLCNKRGVSVSVSISMRERDMDFNSVPLMVAGIIYDNNTRRK